jgi:hypothetical protein
MKPIGAATVAYIFLMLFASSGIAQSSVITTYAGPAFPVDGAQALTQTIGVPQAVSADGAGGFYIGSNQNKVYHVGSDGTLTTLAGNGLVGFGGDNGPASFAQFNYIHTRTRSRQRGECLHRGFEE